MTPATRCNPFIPRHFEAFITSGHSPQGAVGVPPAKWVRDHRLKDAPADLPEHPLTRAEVMSICAAADSLTAYVAVMAWGAQGAGPSGRRYVNMAWEHRHSTCRHIDRLRATDLSPAAAYDLFLGAGSIPGLGPSYFTKLLHFCGRPGRRVIMDQWTARSMNLLTGRKVVLMAGNVPAIHNTGAHYEAFCNLVAELAHHAGHAWGRPVTEAETEERLFSRGGRSNAGPWRIYVRTTDELGRGDAGNVVQVA